MSTPTAPATFRDIAQPWGWSAQRERAAMLLAEDYKSDDEIAAELGITRRSLCNWKKHPVFDERVQRLVKQRRDRMFRYHLARDEEHMADLQRDYDLHEQVRAERGADPTMANVPGGTTGVITRDFKSLGSGENARVVPVYEEDHGWFKTRLALMDQARKLLGKDKAPDTNIALQVNQSANLLMSPEWQQVMAITLEVMEDAPEIKARYLARINAVIEGEVVE
jgi:hypothetical protein